MTALLIFSAMTLNEIIIIKCLYIYKWSMMALLDDDFISTALGIFNVFFSMWMCVLRLFLDDLKCVVHYKIFTMVDHCTAIDVTASK